MYIARNKYLTSRNLSLTSLRLRFSLFFFFSRRSESLLD
jgi:hypothetical protein